MAPVDLPYVNVYRVRGATFAYYRRASMRLRLRGEIGSPEFLANYARTHAQAEAALKAVAAASSTEAFPGSLRALVVLYRASPSFRQLAARTRGDYDRLLGPLLDRFGDLPVVEIPRAWVLEVRDELQAKPRTANYRVAVISTLLAFAVDRGWRADNPGLRIKALRTGPGRRVWTDTEITAMTAREAEDVRLPVLLGLHTAQRLGDVLRLSWSAYDGGLIRLRQSKTGALIVLPASPELRAVLDATPRRAVTICTTAAGRPWRVDSFSHRFAEVRAKLGLAADLHFHGLRHSAATRLAEAGASDAEIQAVTGHKTRAMVGRYTAQARQEQLAKAAVARLPGTRRKRRVTSSPENE